MSDVPLQAPSKLTTKFSPWHIRLTVVCWAVPEHAAFTIGALHFEVAGCQMSAMPPTSMHEHDGDPPPPVSAMTRILAIEFGQQSTSTVCDRTAPGAGGKRDIEREPEAKLPMSPDVEIPPALVELPPSDPAWDTDVDGAPDAALPALRDPEALGTYAAPLTSTEPLSMKPALPEAIPDAEDPEAPLRLPALDPELLLENEEPWDDEFCDIEPEDSEPDAERLPGDPDAALLEATAL